MLRSMTGYSQAQVEIEGYEIIVEIKSVNHKYQKIYLHIPDHFSPLEPKLKEIIKSRVGRGKVNYNLEIKNKEEAEVKVSINQTTATEYIDSLKRLKDKFDLTGELNINLLTQFDDILEVEEIKQNVEGLWPEIKEATKEALVDFIEMREKEGNKLLADLAARAESIESLIEKIEDRIPEMVDKYKAKLEDRLEELLTDAEVNEERLANEVVIMADKSDVTEELVRLKSHIEQFEETLELDVAEPVGRKLDFIAQEMHREINTVGSKINDSEISNYVIDLKSEVDKIREQVRNVE
ncbi:YicC/YloC family endoribonuclease [Acetohalobium arabaticum]|uniref:YicC domain protein n=1 Tax=Acetohalobium arabaticum (strain ATCC 49924 / DSM 5501 / Z-7288) TaxID=574087 RepID=D9QR22_ACEAZ|nr:YicC/YloC family endoribonuclease [Acetohalobium arabaticum]ADL12963.1 YicC domain protein [Acetohalobium arabaticum DSM 5501]